MGISRVFDISRRSLASYQKALDVTSHNIANASNPNYSRQTINFATETPEVNAGMIWGSGVKIDNVFRTQNQLVEYQMINNLPKFSGNEKESYLLGQIEQFFTEPTELGLSNLINGFFNSWSELSVTPNSVPLRNNVIYSAQKLTSKIDNVKESFEITKSDIIAEFKSNVTSINEYLDKIQNLNTRIFEAKSLGSEPNDLMDERDKQIRELSELVNLSVSYDNKGVATISIGGVFAADGSVAVDFEFYEENGQLSLKSSGTGNVAALKSGEIHALKEVYSSKIPAYEAQLDAIINSINDEVNSIHSSGYTIDTPPQTGFDFFEITNDGRLQLSSQILNDPYKISVSSDGTSGNGDLAVSIADISDKNLINNLKISEAYSSLISGIANNKQAADEMASTNKLVLEQLELQKASYSGVSIDEEMTNVIKYQRSYDASAKLIKVADEMLETIMSLV